MMMDQLHPVLHTRPPIGNLRKVVYPKHFLICKAERTVIRRNHLQMIILQSIPQLRLILLLPQRRRKHILRILERLILHVLFNRQQKVLRTRLRKRRNPTVASLTHLIQRILRREMHNVNRRTRNLCHRNRTLHRLRLSRRWPRQRMIDRCRLTLGQRLLHDHVNHAAVLGVHADQRAILRRLLQRLEDRRVIRHQHIRIGHEQLEARHALAHHVIHIGQARLARVAAQIGHNHVQAVVDAGLALSLLPPGVQRIAHLRALRLNSEVHNRRCPSDGRSARARLKVIARRSPAKRHIEMRVRINAARQQQHLRRIHHRMRTRSNTGSHLLHGGSLNQHIRCKRRISRNHSAVMNQQSHISSFPSGSQQYALPKTPMATRCPLLPS